MDKILKRLSSTTFAGLYFILLAIAMAIGTFIENDYGTSTAQKMIYQAKWFEVLQLLFAISLVTNIFNFKLYRKEKLPSFIFHSAIIVIILGAAITRYISYEGIMQIKEGTSNNIMLTNQSYLQLKIVDNQEVFTHNEYIKFGSYFKNNFNEKYKINNKTISVKLKDFIPNASIVPIQKEDGPALLHIVTTGVNGRDNKYLLEGEKLNINGILFNYFENKDTTSVQIKHDESNILWFKSPYPIHRLSMMSQLRDTLAPITWHKFETQHLMIINDVNLVLKEYFMHGALITKSDGVKISNDRQNAMIFEFVSDDDSQTITLIGGEGFIGKDEKFKLSNMDISVSYGPRPIKLPISIYLEDFKLERYEGSNSPSSYASDIRVIDEQNNVDMPYQIYMNHVLNYDGYRFFQSSYTPDETATILSINHDYWGTLVSYIGYFLLTLGFILNLFIGKSRFVTLSNKLDKLKDKKNLLTLVFILFIGTSLSAAKPIYTLSDSFKIIDLEIAENFGKVQIQDTKGRIKPINTYASEILRKVAYKTSIYGQNADQVLLGIVNYPLQWENVPLIVVKHPKLKQILGISDEWAPFSNFLDDDFNYILQSYVENANQTSSSSRGTFEREVLKVDERFNVLYLAFTGQVLRLFPKINDASKKWYNFPESQSIDFGEANIFVQNFSRLLHSAINNEKDDKYLENVLETINFLTLYQNKVAKEMLLNDNKLKAELAYNKYNIFARLIGIYALLGFVLLIALFIELIKPKYKLNYVIYGLIGFILLGFIAHTFNLGLRWYISDRAPWSNGYESLTFIAWAAMLSGIIFMRKSKIALAATSLLTTIILGVAALSWMDPEITNLVPVLKSYWLTIHVSIITASYGFLGLGALLGFFTLLLYILRTNKNAPRINLTIKELSYVNEMTLTIGILLLATGTYLGGVWANESWGRYWGWDSKETWALISVMVYAFILHMRLIPGLRGNFAFNLASIIGIASIIMTYFGVNYYLSGLHSYATGDPVPIPSYIYYLVLIVVVTGSVAYWRKIKFEKISD